MKLNFHYFTIKFIASRSGYSEQDAQLIAATCQFINDNHQSSALYLAEDLVSEAIKKRGLCQEDGDQYKIPLLLSALEDLNNFDALNNKKNQEQILIPFYYFSDTVVDDETDYRVSPIKSLQSSESFNRLFLHAQDKYRSKSASDSPDAVQALRRLGVLLHIASDTFSYVPFNGYKSDVNKWTIKEVKDTRTFATITDRYEPQKYAAYPNVGKFRTGGLSDDYNVQFILTLDKTAKSYTRINNDSYAHAARAVYGFLSNFRGAEPSDQDWNNNLLPMLIQCWNTDAQKYDDLKQHWTSKTGLTYEYNADTVRSAIKSWDADLKPDQQGYFDFLLMLQDVKDAVIPIEEEAQPMLTAGESSLAAITCDFSEPIFNGDYYELSFSASLPTKLPSVTAIVSVLDTDTEQNVSTTYSYKNTNSINEKLTPFKIPDSNKNLNINIEFHWKDDKGPRKKAFQNDYTIIGNATILAEQQLIEPRSKNDRPAIQIVHGSASATADYNYPFNAMYISQDNNAQLDLYAPIHLQLKLVDGYSMLDYHDLSIVMTTPDGHEYKYCNNSKFIRLTEETGHIVLKAVEEWKNRISTTDFHDHTVSLKLVIRVTLEVSSAQESGYRNIVVDTSVDDKLVMDIHNLWG